MKKTITLSHDALCASRDLLTWFIGGHGKQAHDNLFPEKLIVRAVAEELRIKLSQKAIIEQDAHRIKLTHSQALTLEYIHEHYDFMSPPQESPYLEHNLRQARHQVDKLLKG